MWLTWPTDMWLDIYMTNSECTSCQTDRKRENGEEVTQQELQNWMLWGCTCSEEDSRDAQEWMERVTQ